MLAVGRRVQRRLGLGRTSNPAIEVSLKGGRFGRQVQPVGCEGSQEAPVVMGYASVSARS